MTTATFIILRGIGIDDRRKKKRGKSKVSIDENDKSKIQIMRTFVIGHRGECRIRNGSIHILVTTNFIFVVYIHFIFYQMIVDAFFFLFSL